MAGRIDRPECRRLRAEGWTLDRLKVRYGVSRPAVSRACKGVICPVDHSRVGVDAIRRHQAEVSAANRARVRSIFCAGYGPKTISALTGLHIGTVYAHLPPLQSPIARRMREGGTAASQAGHA